MKTSSPYIMQGNCKQKIQISTAALMGYAYIEALSAKHQQQGTKLMPLLIIKRL